MRRLVAFFPLQRRRPELKVDTLALKEGMSVSESESERNCHDCGNRDSYIAAARTITNYAGPPVFVVPIRIVGFVFGSNSGKIMTAIVTAVAELAGVTTNYTSDEER